MKSFIGSIIIFAILIVLVIANSVYIHRSCDEMISILSSLSEKDLEGANRLSEIWKTHQIIYTISIHDSHVDKITELTEDIKSAVTLGNGAEFEKSITLLKELLLEIKKTEELSFQGII